MDEADSTSPVCHCPDRETPPLSGCRHKPLINRSTPPMPVAGLPSVGTLTTGRFEPVVRAGAWFGALPVELQGQLLAMAHVRRLPAGGYLLRQGDASDGLFCVVAGCLRITTLSANGHQAILALAEPPQWFGEIALFDGAPVSHDAWATVATTLLHVPRAPLLALLAAQPAHWHAIGLLLTHKLRAAFGAIEEAALLNPRQRLARRLVALADGWGQSPSRTRREIRVPQEQLGQMLGLTRQTVNQLLRQLAAAGAVRLTRGAIEILDLDALRQS